MDSRAKWLSTRIRMGWMLLGAGVVVAAVGAYVELQYSYLPYNSRIITGLGILLVGIGVGCLVRYGAGLRDAQSVRRLIAEERDERNALIRARAGNRAYWVSATLVYAGLMWASFAASGGLPDLGGDTLWYFLAAGVVIPFGVYATSILIGERDS